MGEVDRVMLAEGRESSRCLAGFAVLSVSISVLGGQKDVHHAVPRAGCCWLVQRAASGSVARKEELIFAKDFDESRCCWQSPGPSSLLHAVLVPTPASPGLGTGSHLRPLVLFASPGTWRPGGLQTAGPAVPWLPAALTAALWDGLGECGLTSEKKGFPERMPEDCLCRGGDQMGAHTTGSLGKSLQGVEQP